MDNTTHKSIAAQLCSDIAIITSKNSKTIEHDASLASLGIDSLSLVEIFLAIENAFNLKLLNSNLCNDDLKSINTLSSKIQSLLSK